MSQVSGCKVSVTKKVNELSHTEATPSRKPTDSLRNDDENYWSSMEADEHSMCCLEEVVMFEQPYHSSMTPTTLKEEVRQQDSKVESTQSDDQINDFHVVPQNAQSVDTEQHIYEANNCDGYEDSTSEDSQPTCHSVMEQYVPDWVPEE